MTILSMLVLQGLVVVGALWLFYPHSNLAAVMQKPILLLISQFLLYGAVAACMAMLVEVKCHAPFSRTIRWNWPRSASQFVLIAGPRLPLTDWLHRLRVIRSVA